MEIAFHLKKFKQIKNPKFFFKHIKKFYGEKIKSLYNNYDAFFQYEGGIYIGNEFCLHLLPTADELKKIEDKNTKITLLTPPLTNKGLKKCAYLLDHLIKFNKPQVVVNDWGILLFIKKNYPKLKISAGRLLNKAFKDPRLSETQKDKFFTSSTFDNPNFCKLIKSLGISGLEQDILPYQNISEFHIKEDTLQSFYFPFGYITTGRVCLTALLQKNKANALAIADKCAKPCSSRLLELKNDSFLFSVFQKGNTVFYLYPASMLEAFVEKAKNKNIRMVYQGDIF
ncbi:MAG: hypothetical protein JRJ44_02825 [Deltaproteobacteria bacterium]|nr:hypothetical protein [Deltaproteobacteria bacterium]